MLRGEAMDEIIIVAAEVAMPALFDEVNVPSIPLAHLLGEFPQTLNVARPSTPKDVDGIFKILWRCS